MQPSDDLYLLIQSLSRAEKRYFKLVAGMGAGRAHQYAVALFDHMAALPVYDETSLKDSLRSASLRRNLPTAKTRLFEIILKSQRLLHSGVSVDTELAALLADLEILYAKQMVRPARKRLRKAKALARHFEREAILLQLLDWEQRLYVLAPEGEEAAFYRRNETEETECMARLSLQRSLVRIYEQIRSLSRQGHQKADAQMRMQYLALVTHPDLNQVHAGSSFLAQALLLAIKGVYALAIQQNEMAWEQFHALMQHWEQAPDRIGPEADFYLGCFNNYLNACLDSEEHAPDFLRSVKTIRSLKGLPEATQFKFQRVAYFQELHARSNFAGFEADGPFIQELSAWLHTHAARLQDSRLLAFYFNLCMFHTMKSEFAAAQKWIRMILNFRATEARADIRDFARIFQIILQFELGNLDLQEYLMRSAYRYLRRTEKLYAYEAAILEFMNLHQKTGDTDPQALRTGLENLHTALRQIQQDRNGVQPLGLQLMIFWAESRLAGVSLRAYYAGVREAGK